MIKARTNKQTKKANYSLRNKVSATSLMMRLIRLSGGRL